MRILVIGNGGREHAIAWKLAQNSTVDKIYCAPGNGGTAVESKCENIALYNISDLVMFAKEENIDVTVVGPEAPLVDGIVDEFLKEGLKIFGPTKQGAALEGSKAYAKEFMKKYNVKTAAYEIFQKTEDALGYINECSFPIVIKADGLAAGKGVSICYTKADAEKAILDFMELDVFKGAGKTVVIEEFLEGVEASILAVTDGNTVIPFISAKDHKTIFEGNKGPNTGGMGAIAPNPLFTEEIQKEFEREIMLPTLAGIQAEKMHFIGILFFGIMMTNKGVYLLEYNVRLGDPETQAVLPLLKSDFMEVILAAVQQRLKECSLTWENKHACCIVGASGGYPGSYQKGFDIHGLQDVESPVFIAGAKEANGKLLTTGGRVLALTALGDTLEKAREMAYVEIQKLSFEEMYYRKDIGLI